MNKKRGIPCIVIGIVISVLGVFPIIAGIVIDNSEYYYNYQFDNVYRSDFILNLPKILLITGAVTIFLGLMLMILGVILYSASGGNKQIPAPEANVPQNSGAANHCAVIDEVDCLTEYQKIGLLSRLGDFKSKTNYGVAIYIKRDDFSEELFKSAYNFYKTKALGQSCVILMLSAANGKMFISALGNCRRLVTDADKERIYNTLQNYIFSGQYYDACIEFVDAALDCVAGANKQNAAPQFNKFNPIPAPQPVSVSETFQPRELDNVNPYEEVKTRAAQAPVQSFEPVNAEPYKPAHPQNITPAPQTEERADSYESAEPVNADPEPVFHNNFCTVCGAAIGKGDKFCVQCGNKLI